MKYARLLKGVCYVEINFKVVKVKHIIRHVHKYSKIIEGQGKQKSDSDDLGRSVGNFY